MRRPDFRPMVYRNSVVNNNKKIYTYNTITKNNTKLENDDVKAFLIQNKLTHNAKI